MVNTPNTAEQDIAALGLPLGDVGNRGFTPESLDPRPDDR